MIENELLQSLGEILKTDPRIKVYAKRGMCRKWSETALTILDEMKAKNKLRMDYEAREINFPYPLSHTFIRASLQEPSLSYLYDGTGVENFEPYFGPEEKAPEPLKNSHLDMINLYHP